jgi:hypothetical protein
MFSQLSDTLPGYSEYYDRVVQRWKRTTTTQEQAEALIARQARLAKALSYVYADIIQFCQAACSIFSTKRGGKSTVKFDKTILFPTYALGADTSQGFGIKLPLSPTCFGSLLTFGLPLYLKG